MCFSNPENENHWSLFCNLRLHIFNLHTLLVTKLYHLQNWKKSYPFPLKNTRQAEKLGGCFSKGDGLGWDDIICWWAELGFESECPRESLCWQPSKGPREATCVAEAQTHLPCSPGRRWLRGEVGSWNQETHRQMKERLQSETKRPESEQELTR